MVLSDLEGGLISPQLPGVSSPTILSFLPFANLINALSNQCSPLLGIKIGTLLWSLFQTLKDIFVVTLCSFYSFKIIS